MGFGEKLPLIPAPRTLSSDPTSSGPHPRTPCGRVSQPPALPAQPALPPTSGGRGFPKRKAEHDFPARYRAAAGTLARPLWLGLTGPGALGGYEGLGKGQLLKTEPESWSALSTPAGPLLVGPSSPLRDKPPR